MDSLDCLETYERAWFQAARENLESRRTVWRGIKGVMSCCFPSCSKKNFYVAVSPSKSLSWVEHPLDPGELVIVRDLRGPLGKDGWALIAVKGSLEEYYVPYKCLTPYKRKKGRSQLCEVVVETDTRGPRSVEEQHIRRRLYLGGDGDTSETHQDLVTGRGVDSSDVKTVLPTTIATNQARAESGPEEQTGHGRRYRREGAARSLSGRRGRSRRRKDDHSAENEPRQNAMYSAPTDGMAPLAPDHVRLVFDMPLGMLQNLMGPRSQMGAAVFGSARPQTFHEWRAARSAPREDEWENAEILQPVYSASREISPVCQNKNSYWRQVLRAASEQRAIDETGMAANLIPSSRIREIDDTTGAEPQEAAEDQTRQDMMTDESPGINKSATSSIDNGWSETEGGTTNIVPVTCDLPRSPGHIPMPIDVPVVSSERSRKEPSLQREDSHGGNEAVDVGVNEEASAEDIAEEVYPLAGLGASASADLGAVDHNAVDRVTSPIASGHATGQHDVGANQSAVVATGGKNPDEAANTAQQSTEIEVMNDSNQSADLHAFTRLINGEGPDGLYEGKPGDTSDLNAVVDSVTQRETGFLDPGPSAPHSGIHQGIHLLRANSHIPGVLDMRSSINGVPENGRANDGSFPSTIPASGRDEEHGPQSSTHRDAIAPKQKQRGRSESSQSSHQSPLTEESDLVTLFSQERDTSPKVARALPFLKDGPLGRLLHALDGDRNHSDRTYHPVTNDTSGGLPADTTTPVAYQRETDHIDLEAAKPRPGPARELSATSEGLRTFDVPDQKPAIRENSRERGTVDSSLQSAIRKYTLTATTDLEEDRLQASTNGDTRKPMQEKRARRESSISPHPNLTDDLFSQEGGKCGQHPNLTDDLVFQERGTDGEGIRLKDMSLAIATTIQVHEGHDRRPSRRTTSRDRGTDDNSLQSAIQRCVATTTTQFDEDIHHVDTHSDISKAKQDTRGTMESLGSRRPILTDENDIIGLFAQEEVPIGNMISRNDARAIALLKEDPEPKALPFLKYSPPNIADGIGNSPVISNAEAKVPESLSDGPSRGHTSPRVDDDGHVKSHRREHMDMTLAGKVEHNCKSHPIQRNELYSECRAEKATPVPTASKTNIERIMAPSMATLLPTYAMNNRDDGSHDANSGEESAAEKRLSAQAIIQSCAGNNGTYGGRRSSVKTLIPSHAPKDEHDEGNNTMALGIPEYQNTRIIHVGGGGIVADLETNCIDSPDDAPFCQNKSAPEQIPQKDMILEKASVKKQEKKIHVGKQKTGTRIIHVGGNSLVGLTTNGVASQDDGTFLQNNSAPAKIQQLNSNQAYASLKDWAKTADEGPRQKGTRVIHIGGSSIVSQESSEKYAVVQQKKAQKDLVQEKSILVDLEMTDIDSPDNSSLKQIPETDLKAPVRESESEFCTKQVFESQQLQVGVTHAVPNKSGPRIIHVGGSGLENFEDNGLAPLNTFHPSSKAALTYGQIHTIDEHPKKIGPRLIQVGGGSVMDEETNNMDSSDDGIFLKRNSAPETIPQRHSNQANASLKNQVKIFDVGAKKTGSRVIHFGGGSMVDQERKGMASSKEAVFPKKKPQHDLVQAKATLGDLEMIDLDSPRNALLEQVPEKDIKAPVRASESESHRKQAIETHQQQVGAANGVPKKTGGRIIQVGGSRLEDFEENGIAPSNTFKQTSSLHGFEAALSFAPLDAVPSTFKTDIAKQLIGEKRGVSENKTDEGEWNIESSPLEQACLTKLMLKTSTPSTQTLKCSSQSQSLTAKEEPFDPDKIYVLEEGVPEKDDNVKAIAKRSIEDTQETPTAKASTKKKGLKKTILGLVGLKPKEKSQTVADNDQEDEEVDSELKASPSSSRCTLDEEYQLVMPANWGKATSESTSQSPETELTPIQLLELTGVPVSSVVLGLEKEGRPGSPKSLVCKDLLIADSGQDPGVSVQEKGKTESPGIRTVEAAAPKGKEKEQETNETKKEKKKGLVETLLSIVGNKSGEKSQKETKKDHNSLVPSGTSNEPAEYLIDGKITKLTRLEVMFLPESELKKLSLYQPPDQPEDTEVKKVSYDKASEPGLKDVTNPEKNSSRRRSTKAWEEGPPGNTDQMLRPGMLPGSESDQNAQIEMTPVQQLGSKATSPSRSLYSVDEESGSIYPPNWTVRSLWGATEPATTNPNAGHTGENAEIEQTPVRKLNMTGASPTTSCSSIEEEKLPPRPIKVGCAWGVSESENTEMHSPQETTLISVSGRQHSQMMHPLSAKAKMKMGQSSQTSWPGIKDASSLNSQLTTEGATISSMSGHFSTAKSQASAEQDPIILDRSYVPDGVPLQTKRKDETLSPGKKAAAITASSKKCHDHEAYLAPVKSKKKGLKNTLLGFVGLNSEDKSAKKTKSDEDGAKAKSLFPTVSSNELTEYLVDGKVIKLTRLAVMCLAESERKKLSPYEPPKHSNASEVTAGESPPGDTEQNSSLNASQPAAVTTTSSGQGRDTAKYADRDVDIEMTPVQKFDLNGASPSRSVCSTDEESEPDFPPEWTLRTVWGATEPETLKPNAGHTEHNAAIELTPVQTLDLACTSPSTSSCSSIDEEKLPPAQKVVSAWEGEAETMNMHLPPERTIISASGRQQSHMIHPLSAKVKMEMRQPSTASWSGIKELSSLNSKNSAEGTTVSSMYGHLQSQSNAEQDPLILDRSYVPDGVPLQTKRKDETLSPGKKAAATTASSKKCHDPEANLAMVKLKKKGFKNKFLGFVGLKFEDKSAKKTKSDEDEVKVKSLFPPGSSNEPAEYIVGGHVIKLTRQAVMCLPESGRKKLSLYEPPKNSNESEVKAGESPPGHTEQRYSLNASQSDAVTTASTGQGRDPTKYADRDVDIEMTPVQQFYLNSESPSRSVCSTDEESKPDFPPERTLRTVRGATEPETPKPNAGHTEHTAAIELTPVQTLDLTCTSPSTSSCSSIDEEKLPRAQKVVCTWGAIEAETTETHSDKTAAKNEPTVAGSASGETAAEEGMWAGSEAWMEATANRDDGGIPRLKQIYRPGSMAATLYAMRAGDEIEDPPDKSWDMPESWTRLTKKELKKTEKKVKQMENYDPLKRKKDWGVSHKVQQMKYSGKEMFHDARIDARVKLTSAAEGGMSKIRNATSFFAGVKSRLVPGKR